MRFETDRDGDGPIVYSISHRDRYYAVGVGLRRVSRSDDLDDLLTLAGRTGLFSFGDELVILDEAQQRSAANAQWRADALGELFEEYGFGSGWLIQATAAPFSPQRWQMGRTFYGVEDIYRVHLHSARELGELSGVAYPIAPVDSFADRIERGKRIERNVASDNLDEFLDFAIGCEISRIESNPRSSGALRAVGRSYVIENLIADRLLN